MRFKVLLLLFHFFLFFHHCHPFVFSHVIQKKNFMLKLFLQVFSTCDNLFLPRYIIFGSCFLNVPTTNVLVKIVMFFVL